MLLLIYHNWININTNHNNQTILTANGIIYYVRREDKLIKTEEQKAIKTDDWTRQIKLTWRVNK